MDDDEIAKCLIGRCITVGDFEWYYSVFIFILLLIGSALWGIMYIISVAPYNCFRVVCCIHFKVGNIFSDG